MRRPSHCLVFPPRDIFTHPVVPVRSSHPMEGWQKSNKNKGKKRGSRLTNKSRNIGMCVRTLDTRPFEAPTKKKSERAVPSTNVHTHIHTRIRYNTYLITAFERELVLRLKRLVDLPLLADLFFGGCKVQLAWKGGHFSCFRWFGSWLVRSLQFVVH